MPVYADQEELRDISIFHPRSLEILKQFLGSIVHGRCLGPSTWRAAMDDYVETSYSSLIGKLICLIDALRLVKRPSS